MATRYVTTGGDDTTGDGTVGNPWASPGYAVGQMTTGGILYIAQGTYTLTTTTPNIEEGRLSLPASYEFIVIGHATGNVTDYSQTPIISAGSLTSFDAVTLAGNDTSGHTVFNIQVNGNKNTGADGYQMSGSTSNCVRCRALNCAIGFSGSRSIYCRSEYQDTKTGTGFTSQPFYCYAKGHATGVNALAQAVGFIANNCTNAMTITNGYRSSYLNCISYKCTNAFGARNASTLTGVIFINTIAYDSTSVGFLMHQANGGSGMINCATGANTAGRSDGLEHFDLIPIELTADPFEDGDNDDFSLNNTSGGGALLRELGLAMIGQTGQLPDVGPFIHTATGGGAASSYAFYG